MDFRIESVYDEAKNRWCASLFGEVDVFNSVDMKKKLVELINEKNIDLYVNCRSLEYIDSTALGALVAVLKSVKSYGGEMHLLNVKPNLCKLFQITNLDKVFILEGDVNE